jgi:hypothetical protein
MTDFPAALHSLLAKINKLPVAELFGISQSGQPSLYC